MPTYEYRCTACGHRFDVFQRISDEPLTVCEQCGGELRKVFHPAGIVFKGSGFYATDSRSKSSSSSKDGKADSKPSETTSESKSDSKSDPKKETSKDATAKKTSSSTESS